MSSKQQINRTLVTIKCQPNNPKKLPPIQIKSENVEPDTDDLIIISELDTTIIISDDETDVPLGNQGTNLIKGNTGAIQIKSECTNSELEQSSKVKPLSIKDTSVSSSFKPLKLKKNKLKKECNNAEIVYRCCNIKFYDKYQHFQHMISHTENIFRRQVERKDIQCYYCHCLFKTEFDMIRHAKSIHTGFYCGYCECNFPKKCLLLRHLTQAHRMTVHNNVSTSNPDYLQWRKRMTYVKKSDKKVKKEKCPPSSSTPNVKITPEIGKVKTEVDTSNIKIEPHTNIKNEIITIKIEPN